MRPTPAVHRVQAPVLSSPGTRAVLIGTGTHAAGSGLPDVSAVGTTVADLGRVLVQRCGMVEGNVRVLADPQSPLEVGRVLAESAEAARDMLLVCYVGHGLVSPGGELYLATAGTERRPGLLAYTALAYTAVRTSLLESPARSIVVILDCCFSGKAVGVLSALHDAEAVNLAQVHGGYVLTSAAREEVALAPVGARHTAFMGEFIGLLTRGDPDGPPLLTLRHAYQYLNRVLSARGFPKPHRRASEWIDDLVLAPNPAYRPPEDTPPGPDGAGPALDVCPYPGLAAFRAEDARWFFGRERVTTELVGRLAARLEQARPVVLVGASGSGKSSLLRAGLLPALSAGTLLVPGSRTWPQLLFTPTADPVGELATQIARLTGQEPQTIRDRLLADPDGFTGGVRHALAAGVGAGPVSGARMVVVVDQFEETFLRCNDDQHRRVFIRALCAAAGAEDGGEPPALVVLGVRADLYGRCAVYPELLPALQDGQVVLGPMRPAELRAAIEDPAHAAGLTLEAGLVETMLQELGLGDGSEGSTVAALYDPGALPLLSHALQATWEHRENHALTLAGYRATGGIHGAIATTAEATFQTLAPAGQQAARRLLLRMVQIGDGVADTRLRADRTTLIAHAPQPVAASAVFEAFADARLITVDEDAAEITHEALLRAWPRLRGWIDADRAGLYTHQQLTDAAHRWDRNNRPTSALYRDTDLAVAHEWAQEPHHYDDLGTLERDFLTASQALKIRQEQASHRRTRRMRQLITSLAVLLVLSMAGGIALYLMPRSDVAVRPISTTATAALPDHPAGQATDLGVNTFWAAPNAAAKPKLVLGFDTPTQLTQAIVHNGDGAGEFQALGRPQDLHLVYFNQSNTPLGTDDVRLEDKPEEQQMKLNGADGATRMEIQVMSVYPAPGNPGFALSEIELFARGSRRDLSPAVYVPVRPTSTAATAETPGHGPGEVTDLNENTFWAAPDAVAKPRLVLVFGRPTQLTQAIVRNGDGAGNFQALDRPKDLHLVYFNQSNTVLGADDVRLEDKPDQQQVALNGADGATRVEIQVMSVYPAPGNPGLALSEIELFARQ